MVAGGNGGAAGAAALQGSAGSAGAGGVGIVGAGLTIIDSNTISGGLGGDGVTRADAVEFTGGTNTLTLEAGYNIVGNVVAYSTADTLRWLSPVSRTPAVPPSMRSCMASCSILMRPRMAAITSMASTQ